MKNLKLTVMTRRLSLLVAMVMTIIPNIATAAESATDILTNASAKLISAKSVHARFTMSATNGTSNGTMVISGNKFYIDTPQIATWFDGKTQWTYAKAQQEVNITTPTADELRQVNPLFIIKNFRSGYNASTLKGSAGTKVVKLTSKNKGSQIATAVVTLNATTLYPSAILLTLSNRQTINIKITSIKTGTQVSPGTFTFNKKKYPDAEIIDLR